MNINPIALTVEILDKTPEGLSFLCFDNEETSMTCFNSFMNESHASYLVSVGIDLSTAYGQMLFKIDNEGIDSLTVGEQFTS